MSAPHPHHHPPHHHHHHHCNSHHYYSPTTSCCCSCCSSSSYYYSSAASSCCCCCCCNNSSSPPPSLPPPPSNTAAAAAAADPLLHALANHLLLLQSPKPSPSLATTPPHPYSYPHLKPYPSPQTNQSPSYDHHHQQQLLHTLSRRISALESSLPHLSPSPHPPPLHAHSKRSPSPKKRLCSPPPPQTLQDLAARTIQTRFRLFLVRRSQTLRHLKRLASIKSHVAALRSSLSDKTRLHPAALSESAMALLLELDAVQGGDPMIREGKRSISRELTRILDFVDKVLVKEKELLEIAENAAYEVIPPTRTGKKVSFFEKEKGRRSPVSSASHEPFSERRDILQRLRRDSGENGIDGSHHQLKDDDEGDEDEEEEEEEEEEKSSESNSESPKAKLGLSAPLPVQMEPRRLTASR